MKTPEEIEELKRKYASQNAAKEKKRKDKKEKYKPPEYVLPKFLRDIPNLEKYVMVRAPEGWYTRKSIVKSEHGHTTYSRSDEWEFTE